MLRLSHQRSCAKNDMELHETVSIPVYFIPGLRSALPVIF